jgi:hypothetical protein
MKPKLVHKKPAEGITAAKKRALKKVYKAQQNLELKEYNKKKDLAYSIIYKACEFNATTKITRSACIKNCELEVIDPTAIGLPAKIDEIYKTKESLNLSKAKKGYDSIMVCPREDILKFLQRFDVTILDMTNCNQPPTDEANCLTLQNALDNGDEELMFLRTSIGMIDEPTYAKCIKSLKQTILV